MGKKKLSRLEKERLGLIAIAVSGYEQKAFKFDGPGLLSKIHFHRLKKIQ